MKAIQRPLRPGTRQAVVSFGNENPSFGDHYSSYVYCHFLPLGLLFWGATEETFVTSVRVGNQSELDAGSRCRIPALYFATSRSFEEVQALADAGELEGALELRQVTQMREASAGTLMGVRVEGPFSSFCMWGLVRDDGEPPRRASVTRQVKAGPLRPEESLDTWLGQVIEADLAGDRVAFEVEGPTAEVVSQLVAVFLRPHHLV